MINFFNTDNMIFMADKPDKYYDLAIVDPPYGIGANKMTLGNGKNKIYRGEENWDKEPPKTEYFEELIRVSKHQVIWGGNYFFQLWQTPCRGFIVWDKGTGENDYADGELAWTSADKVAKIYKKSWVGANAKDGDGRFHPTQKPIDLYRWILKNYAEPNFKILDTHGGSMSIAIACDMEGFDLDICEIDPQYFKTGVERYNLYKRQLKLF